MHEEAEWHFSGLATYGLETTTTVTVKFSSDYVPYGSNYEMTGKEVFMYIGQPYSSVTGLYYLGARYYDTTIGRFISEDSYEGDDNDPMSLNRYAYGRDNPERYTDTSGHYYVTAGSVTNTQSVCRAVPGSCPSVPPPIVSIQTGGGPTSGVLTITPAPSTNPQPICDRFGCHFPSSTENGPGGCTLSGDCGAVVVAGSTVGLTTAGALIGSFASTGGIAGVIVFGFAAGFTIGYVIRNWGHATPQGALNAFEHAFGLANQNQQNPPDQNPPWWSLANF